MLYGVKSRIIPGIGFSYHVKLRTAKSNRHLLERMRQDRQINVFDFQANLKRIKTDRWWIDKTHDLLLKSRCGQNHRNPCVLTVEEYIGFVGVLFHASCSSMRVSESFFRRTVVDFSESCFCGVDCFKQTDCCAWVWIVCLAHLRNGWGPCHPRMDLCISIVHPKRPKHDWDLVPVSICFHKPACLSRTAGCGVPF